MFGGIISAGPTAKSLFPAIAVQKKAQLQANKKQSCFG